MATTANASIDINASVTHSNPSTLGSYSGSPKIQSTFVLSSTDISKVYGNSYSTGSVQALDVNSGLSDQYGTSLVFVTVKSVIIRNTHASAVLVIGGGSNPLFGTDQYTLKAGKTLAITSPFTVDGTHKVLTITPSGASTFDLIIVGS